MGCSKGGCKRPEPCKKEGCDKAQLPSDNSTPATPPPSRPEVNNEARHLEKHNYVSLEDTMFWKRKKEEPEVLDIASLINEGEQQGKVYTSVGGNLIEVGKMNKNDDLFINISCSGAYALSWSNMDESYIKVPSTACSG